MFNTLDGNSSDNITITIASYQFMSHILLQCNKIKIENKKLPQRGMELSAGSLI